MIVERKEGDDGKKEDVKEGERGGKGNLSIRFSCLKIQTQIIRNKYGEQSLQIKAMDVGNIIHIL